MSRRKRGVSTAVLLVMLGCGSDVENASRSEANLAESSTPAPPPVDVGRVEREDAILQAELAALDDPEDRWDARLARFREAERALVRDGELDRASVTVTAAAIRAQMLDTPDAHRDAEAAERARFDRGELRHVPTEADLLEFEQARAHIDQVAARREVPPEMRASDEGIPQPAAPPTEEELIHGGE